MKIPKEKVILSENSLLHNLVLVSLTATLKDEAFSEFLKSTKWKDKDEVDIKFLVEGVELNIEQVLERWESDMDRQIAVKAQELISDKFTNISDFIHNLEKDIKRKVKEELGLEPDEYDY